jgi:hypothetical protein
MKFPSLLTAILVMFTFGIVAEQQFTNVGIKPFIEEPEGLSEITMTSDDSEDNIYYEPPTVTAHRCDADHNIENTENEECHP